MADQNLDEVIFQVREADEGGYIARALGHGIFTQAETLDELKTNAREATLAYFDEGEAPRLIRLHLVKDLLVAV